MDRFVRVPSENASAQELDFFFRSIGVPETPEGYGCGDDFGHEFPAGLREKAHALGLTRGQLLSMWDIEEGNTKVAGYTPTVTTNAREGKTMNKTVYLAGPVGGLTEAEAKGWREKITYELSVVGIKGVCPLRAEPPVNGKYDVKNSYNAEDENWGSARAIAAKNRFDVSNCGMTLAYMPTLSVGTVVEMAWADRMGKSVILVATDPDIAQHPLLMACASWIVPTLEDAVDVITGMMEAY
jgi:nucleoside 2-deoxyribosyltransferase